jgi:hypothetical protein
MADEQIDATILTLSREELKVIASHSCASNNFLHIDRLI